MVYTLDMRTVLEIDLQNEAEKRIVTVKVIEFEGVGYEVSMIASGRRHVMETYENYADASKNVSEIINDEILNYGFKMQSITANGYR